MHDAIKIDAINYGAFKYDAIRNGAISRGGRDREYSRRTFRCKRPVKVRGFQSADSPCQFVAAEPGFS
jgi:hypothetical protein